MIDPDCIARTVGRLARERAEDGFGCGREEFAKLAEAAEAAPDEREKVGFQRILRVAARAKLLAGLFQGFRHKRGRDGFLGGKVVEQRARGDPRCQGNSTGGGALTAVARSEEHTSEL